MCDPPTSSASVIGLPRPERFPARRPSRAVRVRELAFAPGRRFSDPAFPDPPSLPPCRA